MAQNSALCIDCGHAELDHSLPSRGITDGLCRRCSRCMSGSEINLVRLKVLHYVGPKSDKVWGGAVVRRTTTGDSRSVYRYVAFWGRRGGPFRVQPGDWSRNLDECDQRFLSKADEKEAEDYKRIDWWEARYGTRRVVEALGANFEAFRGMGDKSSYGLPSESVAQPTAARARPMAVRPVAGPVPAEPSPETIPPAKKRLAVDEDEIRMPRKIMLR